MKLRKQIGLAWQYVESRKQACLLPIYSDNPSFKEYVVLDHEAVVFRGSKEECKTWWIGKEELEYVTVLPICPYEPKFK